MEQYCELLVQLGEWSEAIAAAPSVSLVYWRSLCARRAASLADDAAEPASVLPFMVAAGNTRSAVDYLLSREEHRDAATLATAHAAGLLPRDAHDGAPSVSPGASQPTSPNGQAHGGGGFDGGTAGDAGGDRSSVSLVCEARAHAYHSDGEPVLAACCFLAHGEASRAVSELLRTHELDVAFAISLCANLPPLQPLLHMLAARAERLHQWALAVDLLQRVAEPAAHVALLAARAAHVSRGASGAAHPPPDVFALASLPAASSYRQMAQTAQRGGNVCEATRCYIVCADVRSAAEVALPTLSAALGGGACDLAVAAPLLEIVRAACLDADAGVDTPDGALPPPLRAALLGWSALEATWQAMWRGYEPILMPLLRATSELVATAAATPHAPTDADVDALTLAVYTYYVRSASEAHAGHIATLAQQLDELCSMGRLAEPLAQAFAALHVAPQSAPPPQVHTRAVLVRGAELASSPSRRLVSFFTGTRINGRAFTLEDGVSHVSLSDAVMWAKLHPFSPTHSGQRINPY